MLTPGSLHPQRGLPLKKSLATPSTSVICSSRSVASLCGFLSLTWDFLAHIDVEVSALGMLGYLPRGVVSTSSSTFACLQDTLVILMSFQKAFIPSNSNLRMSASSPHILRIVISPVLRLKSRGKSIILKTQQCWRRWCLAAEMNCPFLLYPHYGLIYVFLSRGYKPSCSYAFQCTLTVFSFSSPYCNVVVWHGLPHLSPLFFNVLSLHT